MYNERLEQLIDAALADGELTEKEKQILFKKAQEMGVDLDEFEMVLDGRLVKLKKAEEEKAKSSAPKSNKLGDVKKCPSCGAIVQSYQGVCSECGYAFENIEANAVVSELSSLLRKTNDPQKMTGIIDTYPVPMDKGALIAFITWLRPQSFDLNNPLVESYSKKYDECISKARLAFSTDKDFLPLIEQYEKDKKDIKRKKLLSITKKILKNKWFWIGFIILLILFFIFKPEPLNKNPEKTTAAVISAIEKGNISEAEQILLNYTGSEAEQILYNYTGESYGPHSLSEACFALANAYIQTNQLDKAKIYADKAKIYASKREMFDFYLENKMYEDVDKYVNGSDDIEKIIMSMCENGEKERAKKYLKMKKNNIKEGMQSYYGDVRGLEKYKDRIKYINELIASY